MMVLGGMRWSMVAVSYVWLGGTLIQHNTVNIGDNDVGIRADAVQIRWHGNTCRIPKECVLDMRWRMVDSRWCIHRILKSTGRGGRLIIYQGVTLKVELESRRRFRSVDGKATT
jgi:hypothetical protein